jgi:spoIIIJ-associated protein
LESVEASGKSVEDAILQALARLGRARDEVEVVILQEPSRGERGVGAHDARVRVRVVSAQPHITQSAAVDTDDYEDDEYAADEDEEGYEDEEGEYRLSDELTTAALADILPEDATSEEFAIEALRMILGHMGVAAEVEVRPAADDEPLTLNIRGLDEQQVAALIGRKGETLSSLQFIVNMIVSRQSGHRERVIVDAQSYRSRRESNLSQMAHRIADQVRASGAPIMLEAMPPNERRIIHMALADSEDIATESTGEGEQRRVVISLRKGTRA